MKTVLQWSKTKTTTFLDVTPYSVIHDYQHSIEADCLNILDGVSMFHLQGEINRLLRNICHHRLQYMTSDSRQSQILIFSVMTTSSIMDYVYFPNAFLRTAVAPLFVYWERNSILLRSSLKW